MLEEPQSDKELWADVVAGSERSFELVYQRHVARVFRCCRSQLFAARRLSDLDSRAEEVTSDVFVTAWRKRSRITVEDSLLPWLLATAVALCRNNTRAEQRRSRLRARLAQRVDRAPHASTLDRVAAADTLGQVVRAISSLPRPDAQVAVLCIMRDLSTRQASDMLSVAEGTVKSRLHRARKELRRECGPLLRPEGGAADSPETGADGANRSPR